MTAKARATLKSDADTTFADNSAGDISAADLRAEYGHAADSMYNPLDDNSGDTQLMTAAEKTKVGHLTVTAAIDLDALVTSGAGAPATTPGAVGDVYIDTTADVAYIATGTASSADWDEVLTDASGTSLSSATSVGADLLPFFDDSDSSNPKTTTITNFVTDNSLVTLTGSQTLTNKTVTAPVLSGTATGTYTLGGTPTFPATVVKTDTAVQLTAGYTSATDDDGAASSPYTPDPDTSNFKRLTNDGAMTINPPTMASGESCSMVILLTNTTGAGAITFGTTVSNGDTISTTTTDEFMIFITAVDVGGTTYSTATVQALQ